MLPSVERYGAFPCPAASLMACSAGPCSPTDSVSGVPEAVRPANRTRLGQTRRTSQTAGKCRSATENPGRLTENPKRLTGKTIAVTGFSVARAGKADTPSACCPRSPVALKRAQHYPDAGAHGFSQPVRLPHSLWHERKWPFGRSVGKASFPCLSPRLYISLFHEDRMRLGQAH